MWARVAQQSGDPVAFGAQLPLAHLPQGQRRGGVDGQALAAVPAGDGGQLVVDAAGFGAGDVQQVGWVKGAQQLHVHRRTLRAAFARWGLGEPAPPSGPCAPSPVARDRAAAEAALELAIQVGAKGAAERLGVDKATLYLAWRRWGLGRPTDRPEGARATAERRLAASRRADRARHPWRQDRSIWQPTPTTRAAERATAGGER